jgi:hypothetical protein
MEVAEEEKNSEWSIVNRRNNRKGKRTSFDRDESFPTDSELRKAKYIKI